MLLYKTMTSPNYKHILSANSSATLHLIYKCLVDYRTEFTFITRDFWNSIQNFVDKTSPVGNQTNLLYYKDTIDDLFEALNTFIENRNWFADFKGIEFSKHITSRILNKIIFVQEYEEEESEGFLTTDYDLYLEFVNAGAPEHHLADFVFHNSS